MSGLLLNSFRVAIQPTEFKLPQLQFNNWEDYSSYKREKLRQSVVWAISAQDRTVRAYILDGPAVELEASVVNVIENPTLGSRLIEYSFAKYLQDNAYEVKVGPFGVSALRVQQEITDVQLLAGISLKASRPFKDFPDQFTITAQWEASAVFRKDLSDQGLQAMALGLPVLYKPLKAADQQLLDYVDRFLGRIKAIEPKAGFAIVACRDQVARKVRVQDLKLEASPATLRRIEAGRSGSKTSSIFRRLQQLSKVLTPEGRRNRNVLRDRLSAVRSVLAAAPEVTREELIINSAGHARVTIIVGLAPLRAEVIES